MMMVMLNVRSLFLFCYGSKLSHAPYKIPKEGYKCTKPTIRKGKTPQTNTFFIETPFCVKSKLNVPVML